MASTDTIDYLSKHKNNLIFSTAVDADGWIGLFYLAGTYYVTLFLKNVFQSQWNFSNVEIATGALYDYVQKGKTPN